MENIDPYEDRFTLEEYLMYLKAEPWQLDNFASELEYEAAWCQKIKQWHEASAKKHEDERKVWDICYRALREPTIKSAKASPAIEDSISAARIPLLKSECFDEVASLMANDYIPMVNAIRDEAKQQAALGNIYLSREFKINKWRTKKFSMGVDGFVTDMFVCKVSVRDDAPGPFGQKYRICIDRIDPRNYFPDPEAETLNWEDQDYAIIAQSVDIGVARSMFPLKARYITRSLAEPVKQRNRFGSGSGFVTLPGQRNGENAQERERIHLKECWLHDERYKFVAEEYEDVAGGSVKKIRVDDEGYVVGTWEKAFPYGRMIVTAHDKIILEDIPNPFWSQTAPIVAQRMSPVVGGDLIGVGKAADILGLERKVNDVESRVHSYAQSEIERPMHCEVGALTNNTMYYNTTGRSRAIMLKNGGKEFARPVPTETPAFIQPYLMRLDAYVSKITGRPPIMSGNIAEGAQLSNEALQNTQSFGASRYGMQSIFIAQFTCEVGKLVFDLIRETYPSKGELTATIMLPDTTTETIEWNHAQLNGAFFMDIDLASGTPGGKQAANAALMTMFEKGLTDDVYTLQNMGVDGWQDVITRKRATKQDLVYQQSAGRAAGIQIKDVTKMNAKPGKTESA